MTDEPDHTGAASALGRLAARARRAAQSLKDEYEAGKRGDETPAQPIWATPAEQLDAAVRLVRGAAERVAATPGDSDHDPDGGGFRSPPEPDSHVPDVTGTPADGRGGDAAGQAATEVASAMRRIDWASVRTATRDRSGDAAAAARTIAAQVDWERVQPAARRVSMALIGAVASGQLGIGGALGPLVARAIVDHGGLGGQVEDRLAGDEPYPTDLPADLAGVIETTGRELPDA